MGFLSSLLGTDEPPIFKIIKNGDINALQNFGYFDPNQIYYCQPMIYYAIENTKTNLYSVVEYLIKAGCDVNARDQFGSLQETPLCRIGGCNDSIAVGRLLLNNGAKVNARGKNGNCLLLQNSFGLNLEILDLLNEYNADFNITNWKGRTALHQLAFNEYDKVKFSESEHIKRLDKYVARLIKYGADCTIKDNDGDTPKKLISLFNKPAYQVIQKYC